MTYQQFGLIEATDYNNLIGPTNTSNANLFNTTWASGSGSAGYGQTAISQVAQNTLVTAAEWAALVNNTSNIALHQGTTIISVTAPAVSNTVAYLGNASIDYLANNLSTVYSSRLNAGTQGSTVANSVSTVSTWTDVAVWTHTITFANGNAARYFFNSGGQIAMTCSHPSGTGINLLFNNLASNVGTVVLSAPNSGSITVVGTSYNGITKIGGGGSTPTISNNSGYYALTSSNSNVFTQTASTGPVSYTSTNINYKIRTNGPQGPNGDTGSIITIFTTWDEVPNGLTVATGSTVTCTVRLPESVRIANSWGAISVSGIVSVS
jgi:hypothetical protein